MHKNRVNTTKENRVFRKFNKKDEDLKKIKTASDAVQLLSNISNMVSKEADNLESINFI